MAIAKFVPQWFQGSAQLSKDWVPAPTATLALMRQAWMFGVAEFRPAWYVFISSNPPQLIAPSSDISAGGWTPSSGSDLFAMLDEEAASDTDYIVSTSPSTCEVGLGNGGNISAAGGFLRYRLPPGSGTITVTLKQGVTTLHTWGPHTLTGAAQDFEQPITAETVNSNGISVVFESE